MHSTLYAKYPVNMAYFGIAQGRYFLSLFVILFIG